MYTTDTFVPLLLRNLKEGYNLQRAVYEVVGCILVAQIRDQLWALNMDAASQSSRATSPWIWMQ
jgi:hypothetical protein